MASDGSPALVRIESDAIGISRRRFAAALAWAALTLGTLWWAAIQSSGTPWRELAGPAFGLAAACAALSLVARLYSARRAGSISAYRGRLSVERGPWRRDIPIDGIVDGWFAPGPSDVVLRLRGGDLVSIRVTDHARARELLTAACVDASRRTMRVRLGETAFWDIMMILVGPLVVVPPATCIALQAPERFAPLTRVDSQAVAGFAAFVALYAILFWAVRELLGPAHLTIGADGIIVRQRFRRRFIPFDRIESPESIISEPGRVVIRTRDGRVVARARHLTSDESAQLQTRIREAMAVWSTATADAAALALLDRGGRDLPAWRASLAAALRPVDDYRRRRLSLDQVQGALDDPSAPAERRLGAALALAATGEGESCMHSSWFVRAP